ncbi:MAG TPA: hypothetical protein VGQ29_15205 [Gemmatimonadales bacterium]|nr:hypothetical protein [Gemmatimonadales bacterium]
MFARRSLVSFTLLAGALAAAVSCADPSPAGVDLQVPAFSRGGRWAQTPKLSGLLACSQTYDSVTQVVGPAGGFIVVGSHILWVDTMALADTVRITAVAPADTVRWVQFQPDGLQFRTNGAGWSAVLFTSFKDCGVPTSDPLRIAQVTDSLQVIRYLDPAAIWIKVRKNAWSQGNQYIAGVLNHFSQYAVTW